jgi:hypothetical protein
MLLSRANLLWPQDGHIPINHAFAAEAGANF